MLRPIQVAYILRFPTFLYESRTSGNPRNSASLSWEPAEFCILILSTDRGSGPPIHTRWGSGWRELNKLPQILPGVPMYNPGGRYPKLVQHRHLFNMILIFWHPINDYGLKFRSSILTFQFGSFRAPRRPRETCQCWNQAISKPLPQAGHKLLIL